MKTKEVVELLEDLKLSYNPKGKRDLAYKYFSLINDSLQFAIDKLEATSDSKPIDANDISFNIGDTFINFRDMTPKEQWIRIFKMLEENGYVIWLA